MFHTLSVTDASGTYNGNAFQASGSEVGVDGQTPVSGSWSYSYYAGASASGTALSGAPTNVGTYTVVGTFTSGDSNYTGGTAQTTFAIAKATPTVTAGDAGGTYNGQSYPATSATVTGVGADGVIASLGAPSLSYVYYQNGAALAGPPTAAGSYAVVAEFAGNANYTAAGSAEVGAPGGPGDPLGSVGIDPAVYGTRTKASFVTEVGRSMTYVTAIDVLGLHLYDGPGPSTIEPAPAGSPYAYLIHNYNDGVGDDITLGVVEGSPFTIAQATPTVSVTANGGSYNGSAFAASATVNGNSSLEGVRPTLTYYQGTYPSVAQLNGLTALPGAPAQAGAYTVMASFAGSADYSAGTALANFTIGTATPTVSVSAAGGTYTGSAFAASDSVAGVVPGVDNTPSPRLEGVTPTLTYYAGPTASGTPLAGAPTAAGTYTVVATFAGSTDYGSASAQTTFSITQANTSTTLGSSANPSALGQPVTLTATVSAQSPGAGTPTGTVTFQDGGTVLGTAALQVVNGIDEATFTTSALAAGSHSLTAAYSGDTNFVTSSSTALDQVVRNLTTKALSAPSSSVWGQPIVLTATVNAVVGGVGTPGGTVTFEDGSTILGSTALQVVNGVNQAVFDVSSLAAGSHSLTAVYGGDSYFAVSTSAPVSETVNQAKTTTVLTSSANPLVWGQPVTFTATVSAVSPGVGTPTGTVTFKDGSTVLGTAALQIVNGVEEATLTTSALAVGTHSLTAVYSGDSDFVTSTSAILTQKVNKATTTTTLSSSANPSSFGQPVTFTATLGVVAPGAGIPTGMVTFKDGNTVLGTATLQVVNGVAQAQFATTGLQKGKHSITAVYGGDADFLTSTSAVLTQTVQ
jgi:hypothetical protein